MTDSAGSHPEPEADDDVRRERYRRAKAIFNEAVELPEASRALAVTAACQGDEPLRRDVESLLRWDVLGGQFLERPAAAVLSPELPPSGAAQLPPGATLGSYVVERLIGRGGMGEVYLGRDSRLRRRVALKIVGAGQGGGGANAALLREARNASVLSHPCVCSVHEIGEDAGRPFLVLEYVEGETLRELVTRRGRLPPSEILRHGSCIADALQHAHARGIIHRDLKSANVMITAEDRVKVLDFGLALRLPGTATAGESVAHNSQTLAVAGTLDYLAPEVLLGGATADARSDIWSLGVLLYEMATGRPPFRRESPVETASAILAGHVPAFPRGLPLGLRLVIRRCLSRQPARRYQHAADVRAALDVLAGRRPAPSRVVARLAWGEMRSRVVPLAAVFTVAIGLLAAGAWLTPRRGIAAGRPMHTLLVMPLASPSGQEGVVESYLADGITEALIVGIGLTGIDGVIARASSIHAGRNPAVPADLAREFRVDGILEGTVERRADRVRLAVHLYEGTTGRDVWSLSGERPARETAALVASVASAVAGGMHHAVTQEAATRLSAVRAVSPVVYEEYLKGRYHWNQRTEASLQRAIEHYQAALRIDPTYAPAEAALADCYSQLGTVLVGTGSPARFRPLAEAAGMRALRMDNSLSEAHATLGYVRHYEWQWRESEREFQEAIRLNPSNALAHVWYGNLLASLRRFPEALREVERGRELDPFSLVVNTNLGWTLGYAGRGDEAIAQYRKVLAMDAGYVQAHLRLASALADGGRFEEALAEYAETGRLTDNSPASKTGTAQVDAMMGRTREARALLETIVRESRDRYVAPSSVAGVYERLGDVDTAFQWLERAYGEGSNHVAYLAVERHPVLRKDPRYAALLARIGLERSR